MKNHRESPIEINSSEFKTLGYELIDRIAEFIAEIPQKAVSPVEDVESLRSLIKTPSLPQNGTAAKEVIEKAANLLFNHSLLNGHPKFFGYITSSAAPMGALADLLASSVNPNVGAHILSPIATEIEKQTIQWLCDFIGVKRSYGGLLVSGGNMANFTGFLAARLEKAPQEFKSLGIEACKRKMIVYCPKTTHTWIEKAVTLFGHGSDSVRWIPVDAKSKMDTSILQSTIENDLHAYHLPFMVIGTAGDVSTGAVDDLNEIAKICEDYKLWFHVDGAYGAPAAIVPNCKSLFIGMEKADSIALDPHKWLYSPLEAGCTLVKNPQHLINTFSSHPEYYHFNKEGEANIQNFYEYGLQNSRGFRALKVWMALQQVGREGYVKMISEDMELSRHMYHLAETMDQFEAISQNLSICTFRYVPDGIESVANKNDFLNNLNETLLSRIEKGGQLFMSNAIIEGRYCLRACIVNFRTSKQDIEEVMETVRKTGTQVHQELLKN